MFTGLIEELGSVARLDRLPHGARLAVSAPVVATGIGPGDSIAVNGVCLTAVDLQPGAFSADLSPETLSRTTLGDLRPGSVVNLERAMLPTTRFGGHIVQGHVDGRGTFVSAEELDGFWSVRIGFPMELSRYFVKKGSVAVEGISLTIAELGETSFDIAVIPKTWTVTNLATLTPGTAVNLEVDVIAKYVERLARGHALTA